MSNFNGVDDLAGLVGSITAYATYGYAPEGIAPSRTTFCGWYGCSGGNHNANASRAKGAVVQSRQFSIKGFKKLIVGFNNIGDFGGVSYPEVSCKMYGGSSSMTLKEGENIIPANWADNNVYIVYDNRYYMSGGAINLNTCSYIGIRAMSGEYGARS